MACLKCRRKRSRKRRSGPSVRRNASDDMQENAKMAQTHLRQAEGKAQGNATGACCGNVEGNVFARAAAEATARRLGQQVGRQAAVVGGAAGAMARGAAAGAASGANAASLTCPTAQQLTTETVKFKPVRIAKDDGSDPTDAPDLSVLKRVLAKACITLDEQSTTTLRKTAYQVLDSAAGTITAEGLEIWNKVKSSSHIPVIAVKTFDRSGTQSRSHHGGGFTYPASEPAVFQVHDCDPWLTAHEGGHAIGGSHSQGTDSASNPTVLRPTSSPDNAGSENVSSALVTTWRSSSYSSGSGSNCCPDKSD